MQTFLDSSQVVVLTVVGSRYTSVKPSVISRLLIYVASILYSNTTTSRMAATIPRAARSILSESSSLQASNLLRLHTARPGGPRTSTRDIKQFSRSISQTHRYAAIPATSYARKTEVAPKEPVSRSKPDSIDEQSPIKDMTGGLADEPLILDEGSRQVDWTRSYHGLSAQPFSKEAADILMAPIPFDDVEVKPDGIIYLPEIKYRRILNKAFGPGAWGLAPRGETIVTDKSITREYALVAHGRYVQIYGKTSVAHANSRELQIGIGSTR